MGKEKEKVFAKKDTLCGYCKIEILSTDNFCRHCGATLINDLEYDKMDSYALDYAKAR